MNTETTGTETVQDPTALAPEVNGTETVPPEPTPEEVEKQARQKEIDEIVSKRLARERRRHERELEDMRRQITAPKPEEPAKPKAEGKPRAEDFETHDAYVEALADWKVDSRLQAERAKAEEAKGKAQAEEIHTVWTQKLEATHAAHPDLQGLLEEEDLPYTPAMAQTITESEHGGELLYHLAKHPDECRRIAGLTPLAAAREMGRIEAALGSKKPEEKPKTTNAPAPLQPVKGSGSAVKDPSKMTDAEWLRSQRPH